MTTITPGDGDPRHGTANGYNNLRCRCPLCREAWAAACSRRQSSRAERHANADVVLIHGSASTYGNWGCRCRWCTDARNAYRRAFRAAS